ELRAGGADLGQLGQDLDASAFGFDVLAHRRAGVGGRFIEVGARSGPPQSLADQGSGGQRRGEVGVVEDGGGGRGRDVAVGAAWESRWGSSWGSWWGWWAGSARWSAARWGRCPAAAARPAAAWRRRAAVVPSRGRSGPGRGRWCVPTPAANACPC